MPSQKSQPHIPRTLILDLLKEPWMKPRKSFVFTAEAHRLRCDVVGSNGSISAESFIQGHDGGFFSTLDEERAAEQKALALRQNNSSGSNKKPKSRRAVAVESHPRYDKYTILNKAIDDTDPLLACEIIRAGALINSVNGRGQTALLQTLERIYDVEDTYKRIRESRKYPVSGLQYFRTDLDFGKDRLKYIAILLLEQHADVNATAEWQGKIVTPLYLAACIAQDFDLVARLLTHGANPNPPYPALSIKEGFPSGNANLLQHFNQLTSEIPYGGGSFRPLRMCPCFSGKALSECHANGGKPYPDEFLCKCGSKKIYGKCCKLRNMKTVEVWSEEEQWIQPSRVVSLPHVHSHIGPETQKMMNEMGLDEQKMGDLLKENNIDMTALLFNPQLRDVHDELTKMACIEEKSIDPAFAWTYLELGFYPSPQGRSSSKKWCLAKQKEWNSTVDRYIALGTDTRSKLDVECAAKIGRSLGPLYRTCEAQSCGKVEGKDVKTILTCSKCQMTYYCSPDCQKLSWKEHKVLCGTVQQREAPLPAQTIIEDFVSKFCVPMMMHKFRNMDMDIPADSADDSSRKLSSMLQGLLGTQV